MSASLIFMNKKGFTLIELLVVIAIIGILTTIALVSFQNAREKAKETRLKSEVGSFRSAAELNYTDTEGLLFACGNNGLVTSTSNGFLLASAVDNENIATSDPVTDNEGYQTQGLVSSLVRDSGFLFCSSNSNSWFLAGSTSDYNAGGFNSYCVDSSGFIGEIDLPQLQAVDALPPLDTQTCNP
jgi:prepilin-type N-terminal cleavage/methylation domain-containing protein